ncbi:hypothetical protein [Caballeronia sp. 15711]|uniref:hypothetical protein n=1 Tax=Caballeronia sp. 15711 TaxID=3391029 RepID=UPI0039E30DC9
MVRYSRKTDRHREIGAGLAVPNVRHFAETVGAPLVRINTEDERVEQAGNVEIRASALAVLREFDELMKAPHA